MRFLGKSGLAAAVSVTALFAAAGIAHADPVTLGTNCAAGQQVGSGCQFNVETGETFSGNGGPSTGYSATYFSGGTHGNQNWGQVLQDSTTSNPYLTDAVTVNRTSQTTVTITMETLFNGNEAGVNGTGVHYADIFLSAPTPGNSSQPNTNWTYGIALGGAISGAASPGAGGEGLKNSADTAGVYQLSVGNTADYLTSDQVWAPQGGYWIGGDVATTDNVNATAPGGTVPGEFQPPTQIDPTGAGVSALSDLSVDVAQTLSPNGDVGLYQTIAGATFYDLTVTITDQNSSGADLDALFTNYDLFWGTGDCSNDAIWGSAQTADVPAPGALALVGFGLLGIGALRRKAKTIA